MFFRNNTDPFCTFCKGIIVITISNIILRYYISSTLNNYICFWGIILSVIAFFRIKDTLRIPFVGFSGIFFKFFLIYGCIILFRGVIDMPLIPSTLCSHYIWIWLIPFCSLIPIDGRRIEILKETSVVLSGCAIVFFLLNIDVLLSNNTLDNIGSSYRELEYLYNLGQTPIKLSLPAGLFLLCYKEKLSKIEKNIIIIAFVVSLLSSVLSARRTTSAYAVLFLIAASFNQKANISKNMSRYMIISVAIVVLVTFLMPYLQILFPYFGERLLEDTRSGVESNFWADFGSVYDWIWGRGAYGTYYDPTFLNTDIDVYRHGIETGYLSILLWGGVLYLFPLAIFTLIKCKPRFFLNTKSIFYRAAFLYIVINMSFLLIGNCIVFTAQYVYVWLCVSYIAEKKIDYGCKYI